MLEKSLSMMSSVIIFIHSAVESLLNDIREAAELLQELTHRNRSWSLLEWLQSHMMIPQL